MTPLPAPTARTPSMPRLRPSRTIGSLCILLSLIGTHNAALASTGSLHVHLPALPSLGRVLLAPPPVVRAPDHNGTMRALTPRRLAHADKASPFRSLAFPASHPQPRIAARASRSCHLVRRPVFADQASPYMSRLAAAHRRIGFVSYGLSVRLRLLSTPPPAFPQLDDAVAFGYMRGDFTWHRLPPY